MSANTLASTAAGCAGGHSLRRLHFLRASAEVQSTFVAVSGFALYSMKWPLDGMPIIAAVGMDKACQAAVTICTYLLLLLLLCATVWVTARLMHPEIPLQLTLMMCFSLFNTVSLLLSALCSTAATLSMLYGSTDCPVRCIRYESIECQFLHYTTRSSPIAPRDSR